MHSVEGPWAAVDLDSPEAVTRACKMFVLLTDQTMHTATLLVLTGSASLGSTTARVMPRSTMPMHCNAEAEPFCICHTGCHI